jgi:hypothetical protein
MALFPAAAAAVAAMAPPLERTHLTVVAASAAAQLAVFYAALFSGWLATQKQRSWVITCFAR